jgi:ElaB/YqjD/DUF883 family membrane-anchored ribosome-binding protein
MATNPKPADKAAPEDLAAEVAALKKDIAELAASLKRAGRAKAEEKLAEGRAAGEAALEDLEREWDDLETRITGHVHRKPLQSLGIAALVGFFLAVLLRR